jgi:lysozyme
VSFADHPAVTGEWLGESLDFLGPQYAGLKSTAAGRYQINKPAWLEGQGQLQLPDFTPASQDAWTAWRLKRAGALPFIESGDITGAIYACRNIWASLPGSTAGQPTAQLSALLEFYNQQESLA